MKHLSVYYNPYTCDWRMWETENNKNIEMGEGNGLRNYNKQFFYACFDRFLSSMLNEYNDQVTLKFYSRDYECQLLCNYLLKHNIRDVNLSVVLCPIKKTVQERLKDLNAICKTRYGQRINKQYYRVNVYLDVKYTQFSDAINKIIIGNSYCEIQCVAYNLSDYQPDYSRNTTDIFVTDGMDERLMDVDGAGFVLLQGQQTRFVDKINNLIVLEYDSLMNGIKQILFFKTLTDALAFSKEELDNLFGQRPDYRKIFLIEPEALVQPINYIEVGDTDTINYKENPPGNHLLRLMFISDNPDILEIKGNRIYGKAAGNVIVRVWELGAFQPVSEFQCRVEKVIRVTKIQMPNRVVLPKGNSSDFKISLSPGNADDVRDIRIYSSNPQVAIYEKGKIKAFSTGEAVLSVDAPRCSARCQIIVQNTLEQIVPSASVIRIKEKERAKLSFSTVPAEYYKEDIYCSSSRNDIAEYVSGEIIAKKTGVAQITFKSTRGIVGECKVIVGPEDSPLVKMFNKVVGVVKKK